MKALLLFAVLGLVPTAFAGKVIPGDKVNLTCQLKESYRNKSTKAQITVVEKEELKISQVPEVVPETFLNGMKDDKYFIRRFEIKGDVTIAGHDGQILVSKKIDKNYFGNLSYPAVADGIYRVGAYGSYAKDVNFRAFTIEQDSVREPLDIDLYYQVGFASNLPMNCSGTLPTEEIVRRGVIRKPAFHREFKCHLKETKKIAGIDFTMKLTNLQNRRLLDAVDLETENGNQNGWFVNGVGVNDHLVGKLNDGDASLLRKEGSQSKPRLVSKYWDECGSPGCYMVELDLPYPKASDKSVRGSFRYRVDTPTGDGESKYKLKFRTSVSCDLIEIKD